MKIPSLCLVLSCIAVSLGGVKADQQAAPAPHLLPAVTPWAASESDVLGDWQTAGGEGWRIKLLSDHTIAAYFEGVFESKPALSTWKLEHNHLIIHDASIFQLGKVKDYSNDLVVLRVEGHVVLLPRENLALVQRYGLASFFCFWRWTTKGLDALPTGEIDDGKVIKQLEQGQGKRQ